MVQENDLDIGDEVYVVDSNQPSLPFTFGRAGEVIDLDDGAGPLAITLVTIQFNDDIQTYNNGDLYIPSGCLPTDAFKTGRSEVCVSESIPIDIYLPSLFADALIPFAEAPRARVLAVNKSRNSIMIRFLELTAGLLSQGRPVVYSVDDISSLILRKF